MTRTFAIAAACGATLVTTLAAQTPVIGTGQLAGTVVTTDASPAPVRRAIVTLRDQELFSRSEITDDQGRFAFRAVPAGRFTLTASRPAFITATYGARRLGQPGTSLSLSAGQVLTDVRLHMTRGAAISGVVRDPLGRPAARVEMLVKPIGVPIQSGTPGFVVRGATQIVTDDRGMYRAFGLEPGTYLVAALPHFGSLSGAGEMRAMTGAEIDLALRRGLQDRQQRPTAPSPPVGPSRRQMYVAVFHPGTISQSDATAITVKAGDDIGGVDVQLRLVSAVTVEGRVARPDGAPATNVQLITSGADGRMPIAYAFAPILSMPPGPDGRFKYTSVAPGQYQLIGRASGGLWAIAHVNVGGDDVADVTLLLQPPLVFSGQLRFDAATLTPPANLAAQRVTLLPPGTTGGGVGRMGNTLFGLKPSASANADVDGIFEVPGIIPGPYIVSTTVPPTWWLRSVMVNDRDMLDEVMLLERSVPNAVIVFTDRRSELSGTLQTQGAAPAVEYVVLVFSADRRHWFEGSRRTKTARPGSDGRYVFGDLPAGDYLVAALEDVDPKQLVDPAFLEAVVAAAVKVSVSEGGKVQLDLKVARQSQTGTTRNLATAPGPSSSRSPGAR